MSELNNSFFPISGTTGHVQTAWKVGWARKLKRAQELGRVGEMQQSSRDHPVARRRQNIHIKQKILLILYKLYRSNTSKP